MSEKDIKLLAQKLSASLSFWQQQSDTLDETLEKHSNSIYGGPSKSTIKDEVIKVLTLVINELESLLEDREEVADYTKKTTRRRKED